MFEELMREIKKLEQPRTMSISIALDDKRFYDRRCSNSECEGIFKVHFDDWSDKVADRAFCPFCRHEADKTDWHTPEQEQHIKTAARAEMSRLLGQALKQGVARSRPTTIGGGLINISMSLDYKPGRIPQVVPATASDELRQDFVCERCSCRFASIGASFFCPACGQNSAESCFNNTLETVRKTVEMLPNLETTITQSANPDLARDAIRQLLEDQFARLVGAFERLNEALFDKLPNANNFNRKGSVFQRLDDASNLWQQAAAKGYGDFLSPNELARLKILFQRRHILSHRQGIVDDAYLAKSGDTSYSTGQRLVVRDSDVLELCDLLGRLATGLAK
jgi:hypothetical protein